MSGREKRSIAAHAIEAQKQIISIMTDIDDVAPELSLKEGRIHVALNVLANETCGDDDDFISPAEARDWITKAIAGLPDHVELMGSSLE